MVETLHMNQVPEQFVVDFNMNLITNGFNAEWMKELFPVDTEDKFERIFVMFDRLGFSGEEAAIAIRGASAEFQRNYQTAEQNGWPLKYRATLTDDFTRPEAYFIELLASTVMEMRRQMAEKRAV